MLKLIAASLFNTGSLFSALVGCSFQLSFFIPTSISQFVWNEINRKLTEEWRKIEGKRWNEVQFWKQIEELNECPAMAEKRKRMLDSFNWWAQMKAERRMKVD